MAQAQTGSAASYPPFLPSAGLTRRLLASLESNQIPHGCLTVWCVEGDNREDAYALVKVTSDVLGLGKVNKDRVLTYQSYKQSGSRRAGEDCSVLRTGGVVAWERIRRYTVDHMPSTGAHRPILSTFHRSSLTHQHLPIVASAKTYPIQHRISTAAPLPTFLISAELSAIFPIPQACSLPSA
jgi:hypothetical protein